MHYYKALIPLLLITLNVNAQDPKRFEDELEPFLQESSKTVRELRDRVLFTGSSTIRMWKDIQEYFPEHQVLNRGFGGSEMSDLLHYQNSLISKYRPSRLFIYEGDNDIANGEKPDQIIGELRQLILKVRNRQPVLPIVLISAKPSISRWHLRDVYIEYNTKLEELCTEYDLLYFADTWKFMLNDGDYVNEDLFIEDGLHMNKKGYDLWAMALAPYMP